MTPQRFDPATHGELGSSSMTRQEGTAIFKGNAARRAAWERREAIVSHPAFHMGQGAPRHDPVRGEQERESMRPIEHGRDFFQDLGTGATEVVSGTIDAYRDMTVELVRGLGQIAEQVSEEFSGRQQRFRMGQNDPSHDPIWGELERETLVPVDDGRDDLTAWNLREQAAREKKQADRAIAETRAFLQGIATSGSADDENDSRMDITILSDDEPRSARDAAASAMTEQYFVNVEEMHRVQEITGLYQDYGKSSVESLDMATASKQRATQITQQMTDSDAELADAGTRVNEVIGVTTSETDAMSAAFAVTSGERLPEVIGQMGTLEVQTLAAVDALGRLTALPRMPSGSGGSSTRPSDDRPGRMEEDPLAHDPRYNPSGGESWGHYYQVAVNLAKNGRTERERKLGRERAIRAAHKLGIPVPSFAGGTPFAPGGMALVGEMGPELVNLPRGSQVIPNPQLGSEVTVNVNVEGSVVAERDLAQRIRQELIRTSRRTVDLGFVA